MWFHGSMIPTARQMPADPALNPETRWKMPPRGPAGGAGRQAAGPRGTGTGHSGRSRPSKERPCGQTAARGPWRWEMAHMLAPRPPRPPPTPRPPLCRDRRGRITGGGGEGGAGAATGGGQGKCGHGGRLAGVFHNLKSGGGGEAAGRVACQTPKAGEHLSCSLRSFWGSRVTYAPGGAGEAWPGPRTDGYDGHTQRAREGRGGRRGRPTTEYVTIAPLPCGISARRAAYAADQSTFRVLAAHRPLGRYPMGGGGIEEPQTIGMTVTRRENNRSCGCFVTLCNNETM